MSPIIMNSSFENESSSNHELQACCDASFSANSQNRVLTHLVQSRNNLSEVVSALIAKQLGRQHIGGDSTFKQLGGQQLRGDSIPQLGQTQFSGGDSTFKQLGEQQRHNSQQREYRSSASEIIDSELQSPGAIRKPHISQEQLESIYAILHPPAMAKSNGASSSVVTKPDSQGVQPTTQVNEDDNTEPVKDTSPTSVFVNSEPIREDQVQNAVKFLSHPKVRGSPVMYRRSFLEKKGLTKEEIDEAFRRVPDPTPSVSSTQTAVANQDEQQKSPSDIKAPLQPSIVTPTGNIVRKGTFSSFHWSHAVLAVGALAVSGAGTALLLKRVIVPKFKSWIRKVVSEEEEEGPSKKSNLAPTFSEEAAAAAKAAAAAASDVARASQEMLLSKREDKKYFEDLTKLLDIQVHEIKSMSNAIQKLEGQGNALRNTQVEYDDYGVSASASRVPQQPYRNGNVDVESRSVRYSSPAAPADSSAPPHQRSYMEASYTSTNVFQAPQGNGNSSAGFQDNQLNGTNSTSWWQQKNVKISEIETEDEQKMGPSGVFPTEGRGQRSWVPPPPPPVAMAEAAAAIRQLKKPLSQQEHLTDDQLLSQAPNASDELQRVTKISESGGFVEANGGSSGLLNTSEMQKGEEPAYLEA